MKELISAAVLPAIFLLMYVRKKDKIESEPVGLVIKLFIYGGITVITAMIMETIGLSLIKNALDEDTMPYLIVEYFIVVAGSEEAGKYFAMKHCTWRSPEFNYTYDAIVYAVATSLGFAAAENILYVLQGGLEIALMRALTAVPGHAVFSVFMGYHYGLARKAAARGDYSRESSQLAKAYIMPVLMHGFYDFCLAVGSWEFIVIFFVFYVGAVIYASRKINKLSREDAPVNENYYINNY